MYVVFTREAFPDTGTSLYPLNCPKEKTEPATKRLTIRATVLSTSS